MNTKSSWIRLLVTSGSYTLFQIILLLSTTGFFHLFSAPKIHKIYGEEISVKQKMLEVFYKNRTDLYYIDYGICKEAVKNGIEVDGKTIFDFIRKMPQFQKTYSDTTKVYLVKQFILGNINPEDWDKSKYDVFLKEHSLCEKDIFQYARMKCLVKLHYKILKQIAGNLSTLNKLENKKFDTSTRSVNFIIKLPDEELAKITDEEVEHFIEKAFKNRRSLVIDQNRLSGTIYIIPKNVSNLDTLNEGLMYELIKNKNWDEVFDKHFSDPQTGVYKKIRLNNITKFDDSDYTDVLFTKELKFVHTSEGYAIAKVDDVKNETMKVDESTYQILKKEAIAKKNEYKLLLYAQNLVNKYNSGEISLDYLKKHFVSENVTGTFKGIIDIENLNKQAFVKKYTVDNNIKIVIPQSVTVVPHTVNDQQAKQNYRLIFDSLCGTDINPAELFFSEKDFQGVYDPSKKDGLNKALVEHLQNKGKIVELLTKHDEINTYIDEILNYVIHNERM